ncbi:dihydroorotate dehydrogenase [Rossellomorea aquimaris]|uniref:Dihydroorotate dehydrogenase n=1 Tax=Rossellomorea aquimaris TaxID=189382 RepID=A0A366F1Y3_9BACI|nr:dihydroorotate dehydrogenase [Rossellomorea aquimaris]RBP07759.1 dihydroorotate dehydrogenase [Rossellomorea aquimaris]
MPDWSYHGIFKPALSKLPAYMSREFIHRGMSTIASLPLGPHIINFLGREECPPQLKKQINGIEFANPVGLSGKIDPLLTGTSAFTHLGFGFIEIGPVTLQGSSKSFYPVADHSEQRIQFSDPLESIGLERTLEKLKKIRKKQPFFIRLSGTPQEISIMMKHLDEFSDGYILDGNETSYTIRSDKPIFISNPPFGPCELTVEDITGIVVEEDEFNTLLSTVRSYKKATPALSIITSGGVREPSQALSLLNAGADLLLLSDGYVFSGPGLTKRINEALLDDLNDQSPPQKGWLSYWYFGFFIFIGGLLALLFSLTSVILPYDEHYLGMQRESIAGFNDRIVKFMAHDRMTLAGTMISGGIVYMQLSFHGVRRGLLWAKQSIDIAAITGFLGIFLFIGYGYFDWLHLLFWLVLLPFYVYGWIHTREIKGTPSSGNRKNHHIWLQSLHGQLAFVVLGFSFVLGGLVISYFGITSVFVPTDLLYLCMPPEILHEFNQNLIPVIAHDRAGFGSALLSVGLLVLTLSLWGFQQGNKWVWRTLLIGGLPAFISGIYIHFAIGYTSFIHLLPAYFAIGLFLIGLVKTYSFFYRDRDNDEL